MRSLLLGLVLLSSQNAWAQVTLPYVFAPGQTIQSSQTNANFTAVANEINSHENAANPHNTTLAQILALGNSCGTYSINFNGNQALDIAVENVTADPTPGLKGRLIYNTVTGLFKVDNGTAWVSVGGTGVNNLSSVLNSGNSAGSFNIDVNENQLLHARVENLASNPSSGNAGRLYLNTSTSALMLDTGTTITAIGGSQGLASVLGVSNSAGTSDINFNGHQGKNLVLDSVATDPAVPATGQVWYNTASNIPKFWNGTSSLAIGNTNTLAQTLALGNSAGTLDIDFNGHQAQHMVLFNNLGAPGTGTGGYLWYDTGNSQIGYETGTVNHYLGDLDSAQTLTNKTISGSANTLTNIQDSSLSANVVLKSSAQTITGQKTFSADPVIAHVQSGSGATLTVPTGTANDTFALLGATETFSAATLVGPTFTSNSDFSYGQALHFRVENLAADPTASYAGRLYYKTTTGELKFDTGSSVLALAIGNPTLSSVLQAGNSAGTSNINMNENQLIAARAENVASLPAAGNAGRTVFDTANSTFYIDNGTSWLAAGSVIYASNIQTVTANTSLTNTQVYTLANCSLACTITLPLVSGVLNGSLTYSFTVKKIGSAAVTVAGNGTDKIDGSATVQMSVTNSSLTFLASSTGWQQI